MATSNAATNYLERRLLHYIFKNNSLTFNSPGDNIYVGLATAVSAAETGSVTEASFGGYARQNVTAANWTTIGADSTDTQTAKNTNAIDFPAKTDSGTQTITHVIITDASSSGNTLFVGELDVPKTLAEGDIFRINATNLSIELK
tara:strand:+ start:250 stop:684 length:435 start_codon:yes stop_codon:yes gene_type:complete